MFYDSNFYVGIQTAVPYKCFDLPWYAKYNDKTHLPIFKKPKQ